MDKRLVYLFVFLISLVSVNASLPDIYCEVLDSNGLFCFGNNTIYPSFMVRGGTRGEYRIPAPFLKINTSLIVNDKITTKDLIATGSINSTRFNGTYFGDGQFLTGVLGSLINNDLGWITNAVSNLVNYFTITEIKDLYYNKSNSYNRTEDINGDTPIQVIIDLNPEAYWRGNGSFLDSSGNGHTLTKTAGTALFGDRGATKVFRFDGSTHYKALGYAGVLGGTKRTIIAWIKSTGAGNHQSIVSYGDLTVNQIFEFVIVNEDPAQLGVFTGEGLGRSVTDPRIIDGKFHLVAVVLENDGDLMSELKWYIDGDLLADDGGTTTAINTDSGTDTSIGARLVDGSLRFEGSISDVAIFDNIALTSDEILNIYNAQKTRIIRGSSNSQIDWTDAGSDFSTGGSCSCGGDLTVGDDILGFDTLVPANVANVDDISSLLFALDTLGLINDVS